MSGNRKQFSSGQTGGDHQGSDCIHFWITNCTSAFQCITGNLLISYSLADTLRHTVLCIEVLNVLYFTGLSHIYCAEDNSADVLENVFELSPYGIVSHNCRRLALVADAVFSNPEFNILRHKVIWALKITIAGHRFCLSNMQDYKNEILTDLYTSPNVNFDNM